MFLVLHFLFGENKCLIDVCTGKTYIVCLSFLDLLLESRSTALVILYSAKMYLGRILNTQMNTCTPTHADTHTHTHTRMCVCVCVSGKNKSNKK